MENKLFVVFGIIVIISGITSAFLTNEIMGISGAIVGVFLVYLNLKAIKDKNKE